ncbi:MAG: hypothetical protein RL684_2906 [Pseudomonadota bacterium]
MLACLGAGAAAAADSSTSTGNELEEVIVTAQKTSETASKTPIALSVFSGSDLKEQGVANADSLANIAPSVAITNTGHGSTISIRGITSTDITSKGEQAVSFNLDGIAIGRPEIQQLAFFDLDRIEVLRGPQGTLYGKSSTAGAINVITAKPQNAFDAAASVEIGNFNTRRADGMINVPVSENFALRLAVNSNMRDGYLNPVLHSGSPQALGMGSEKPLNAEDNTNVRLSALWKFGNDSSLLLQATGGHLGGSGNTSGTALFDRFKGTGSSAREVYYNPMATGVDDNYRKYNAELNIKFGPVRLTYNGGYLTFDGNDNPTPSTGLKTDSYSWSQYLSNNNYNSHEVRLSNAEPQRFEYVVGANYWREQTDETDMGWGTFVNASESNPQSFENLSPGVPLNCTVPAPNTVAGCTAPNPNIVGLNQHEAKGIFGQTNFHVTDAFKLTAGLRYSSDSMFRHASIAAGPAPNGLYWADVNGNPCHPGDPCVPLTNGQSGTVVQNDVGSQSASKVTWRLGADYQVASNQMVYGYVATGYKAGSFNDICPGSSPPGPCSYGAESMTAYELGYKGKILPNLEIDSSLYYYDYAKYQLTGAKFLSPSLTGGPPLVLIYTTLVPLSLSGWEGELHWNITKDDLVNVTAAIESGHYRSGPGHATAGFGYLVQADWSDKRLDALPTWAGTLSYEHRFELRDGGYISARLNSKISAGYYESDLSGQYNGPPFGGPPGGPPPFNFTTFSLYPTQYEQGSFTRTDFDLGYTSASGKFTVDAYVRNIEDKMQMTGSPQNLYAPGQGSPDQVTVAVSAPRTIGLRLGVRY